MTCKICGKEIKQKTIQNKEICKECILAAKILGWEKSRFTKKEIIKIIIIIGVLLLLAVINICAMFAKQTPAALLVTAMTTLFGFIFLTVDE